MIYYSRDGVSGGCREVASPAVPVVCSHRTTLDKRTAETISDTIEKLGKSGHIMI